MHPGILISKSGKSIIVVESVMRPVWEIKISFTELICINSRKKEGEKGVGGGEGGCDAYVSPANTNQLTATLRFHFKENSLLSS